MESKKYNLAIVFYRNILNKGKSNELGDEFYGDVYHNLGVAYARMFEYSTAAACFKAAYNRNKKTECMEAVIKADLLEGNDKKLMHDQNYFKMSDVAINKIRAEVISIRANVQTSWDKMDKTDFVKKCKKEYFVEINA